MDLLKSTPKLINKKKDYLNSEFIIFLKIIQKNKCFNCNNELNENEIKIGLFNKKAWSLFGQCQGGDIFLSLEVDHRKCPGHTDLSYILWKVGSSK